MISQESSLKSENISLVEYVTCNLCGADQTDLLIYNDNTELCVAKCRKCGLVYVNPRPVGKNLKSFYSSEEYVKELKELSPDYFLGRNKAKNQIEYISRHVDLKSNQRKQRTVLDIGGGAGLLLHLFQKYHFDVYEVEPNLGYSEYARKKFHITVYRDSFENLTLPVEYFDMVTLSHVLEHFLNPLSELKKIWKILKKGGFLFIEVPNSINNNQIKRQFLNVAHNFFFTPQILKKLLEKAGFEIVTIDVVRPKYPPILLPNLQKLKIPRLQYIVNCYSNIYQHQHKSSVTLYQRELIKILNKCKRLLNYIFLKMYGEIKEEYPKNEGDGLNIRCIAKK